MVSSLERFWDGWRVDGVADNSGWNRLTSFESPAAPKSQVHRRME